MNKPEYHTLGYFLDSMRTIIAIVLVWRGVWYMLDAIDRWLFDGNHFLSAVAGVIIGVALMYIPKHDLKEINNL